MQTADTPHRLTMNRSTRFWDKIADRYARKPVPDEAVYQKKLELSRQYFRPDMEVLEIGCGTGSTAIAHAPYVGHIRAVDISSRMIDIANSKAEAEDIDNVTFEQMAIDDLEIAEESQDAVLALSVLHLLKDKEKVIAEIYKGLNPGGVFISSTACIGDMAMIYRFILPMGHFLGLTPLVKIFTDEELLESLTSAGFAIEHQWQPGKGKAVFIVATKPD